MTHEEHKNVSFLESRLSRLANVQQAVENGTLDNLNEQSFLNVWGRRSGDRVLADIFLYSNPQFFKKPGSQ